MKKRNRDHEKAVTTMQRSEIGKLHKIVTIQDEAIRAMFQAMGVAVGRACDTCPERQCDKCPVNKLMQVARKLGLDARRKALKLPASSPRRGDPVRGKWSTEDPPSPRTGGTGGSPGPSRL